MKFRKFLVTALSLALLAGCGGGSTTTTTTESGTTSSSGSSTTTTTTSNSGSEAAETKIAKTVTVGVNVNIATLNFHDPVSQGNNNLNYALNGRLYYQTETGGELINDIAKSYDLAEDGKTLTVEIYDYVHDSEGNDIKASDVAWSYNHYIETGNATGIAKYLDTIEAVDDTHVLFNIKEAHWESTIAYQAILTGCAIYSEKAYDDTTWATAPVTTGAYKVESFTSGATVVLVKDDNYWQKEELRTVYRQQNVERMIFKIILENSQMSLALQTGDIDMIPQVGSEEDLAYFASNGEPLDGYTMDTKLSALAVNMTFNRNEDGGSPLADDLALRQAIAYAIDRPAITKAVLGSLGKDIHTQGNEAYYDYNLAWNDEDYSYDLDKAKEKLAESNYAAAGSPTIRIMCVSQDDKTRLAQLLQSYLIAAGINAEVLSYDTALYDNYKYDYTQWDLKIDNQMNGFSLIGMWSNFWDSKHTSYNGKSVNFWGENNPELDALVAAASNRSTASQEAVDACFEYAVIDNCNILGIWSAQIYSVAQDGITQIVTNAGGFPQPQAFVYSADYVGCSDNLY